MSEEQESNRKAERMILQMNKQGLSDLTVKKYNEALEYFRKAEKFIMEELKINPNHLKINQLAAITYNNLACYYKANNKPKVALSYLKKALEIQVFRVEDWTSTASTHLNICAIYSYLGKHQESTNHAELALEMLQKVDTSNLKKNEMQGQKSYYNTKMLSYYNLAVEQEYLKNYAEARRNFILARQTATFNNNKNNTNMINSIEDCIHRVQDLDKMQKNKLYQLLAKKRVQEEKGNHESMRKNKKNFGDQGQWRQIVEAKKYELYKTDHQTHKKHYQSSEKVKKLAPIQGSKSKRGLQPT